MPTTQLHSACLGSRKGVGSKIGGNAMERNGTKRDNIHVEAQEYSALSD
jgi:hypothetical protein